MDRQKGRSGVGLIGSAVLAIVLIVAVAIVAALVGHQLALAEETLAQMAQ